MKKTSLLSSILIASTLTLGACEYPKDVPVMNKAQSDKFKQQAKNKKNSQNKKKIYFSNETGASYTLDKQIEAMEIISVALGQFEDSAAQFTVEKSEPTKTSEGQLQKMKIDSKTSVMSTNKNITIQGQKTWTVSVLTNDAGIVLVEATADKNRLSLDMPVDGKKNYVNVYEDSMSVQVRASAKPGLLDVTVNSKGYMNGGAMSTPITKDNFEMTLSFNVNEDFLGTSKIALLQTSGFFKKSSNPKLERLNTRVTANTMSLDLRSMCSGLLGQATVNGRGTMSFETDHVVLSNNKKVKLMPCGSRSVIDLARLRFSI